LVLTLVSSFLIVGSVNMAEFVKLLQRVEVESFSSSSSPSSGAARPPTAVAAEASDLFRLMETRGDGYLRWSDFSSFVINMDISGSGRGGGGGATDPDALVPGAGSSSSGRRPNAKKKHGGSGARKNSGGAAAPASLVSGTQGLPPPVYGRVATTVGVVVILLS